MKTLEEIRNTPISLLTDEELAQLDPQTQAWARNAKAIRAREAACPKHELIGTSTRNGYHSLRCKHCGKDFSYDSGD